MKKILCMMLFLVFFVEILSSRETTNEPLLDQLKTDSLSLDTLVKSDTLRRLRGSVKMKDCNVGVFDKLPCRDSIFDFFRWRMENKSTRDSILLQERVLQLKWQRRNSLPSKRWKIERPTHE